MTQYRRPDTGEMIEVCRGIGEPPRWIVGAVTPRGGHKRVKSSRLPPVDSAEACQANLDRYAAEKGWEAIGDAHAVAQPSTFNSQLLPGEEPPFAVDEEFEALCPPLLPEEAGLLEAAVAAEGCRDPLVVWREGGLLLDGHHRLRIGRALGLPLPLAWVSLENREMAIDWIARHQLGRRNLTEPQRAYLRGKRYRAERQPHGGDRKGPEAAEPAGRTAERLGEEYGVSAATIRRDGQFSEAVDALAEKEDTSPLELVKQKKTRAAVREEGSQRSAISGQREEESGPPEAEALRPRGRSTLSSQPSTSEGVETLLRWTANEWRAVLARQVEFDRAKAAGALRKLAEEVDPEPPPQNVPELLKAQERQWRQVGRATGQSLPLVLSQVASALRRLGWKG